jgi:hypothetical protein
MERHLSQSMKVHALKLLMIMIVTSFIVSYFQNSLTHIDLMNFVEVPFAM